MGIYMYPEGGYIRFGFERCLYYILYLHLLVFQVSCRCIGMNAWFVNSNDKLC